jgi:hypothetical protein
LREERKILKLYKNLYLHLFIAINIFARSGCRRGDCLRIPETAFATFFGELDFHLSPLFNPVLLNYRSREFAVAICVLRIAKANAPSASNGLHLFRRGELKPLTFSLRFISFPPWHP